MCWNENAHPERGIGRRRFLRLAALGAGGALLAGAATPLPASASGGGHGGGHGTDALLLSCMDFRLIDEMALYMHYRGLTNRYDQVILAGASLGVLTDKFPVWSQTFWHHVDISLQLHHIKKVVVLDHRDCGAYKTFLGKDFAKDPELEYRVHAEHLNALRARVKRKHPDLDVELLLMGLDGNVEKIA